MDSSSEKTTLLTKASSDPEFGDHHTYPMGKCNDEVGIKGFRKTRVFIEIMQAQK